MMIAVMRAHSDQRDSKDVLLLCLANLAASNELKQPIADAGAEELMIAAKQVVR